MSKQTAFPLNVIASAKTANDEVESLLCDICKAEAERAPSRELLVMAELLHDTETDAANDQASG
jgi:hypothetical protein